MLRIRIVTIFPEFFAGPLSLSIPAKAAAAGSVVYEIVGQYAPRQGENALNLRSERVNYWLDNGALPSDTVRSLLRRAGILKARHEQRLGRSLQSKAVPLSERDESAEGGAA